MRKITFKRIVIICVILALFSSFGVFAASCSGRYINASAYSYSKSSTAYTSTSHTTYNPYCTAKSEGKYTMGYTTYNFYGPQKSGGSSATANWAYEYSGSITFTQAKNVWTIKCGNCGDGSGTYYGTCS